jgi:hypothetical protein
MGMRQCVPNGHGVIWPIFVWIHSRVVSQLIAGGGLRNPCGSSYRHEGP